MSDDSGSYIMLAGYAAAGLVVGYNVVKNYVIPAWKERGQKKVKIINKERPVENFTLEEYLDPDFKRER